MATKCISYDLPVNGPAIQITSRVLSKEISKTIQMPYRVTREMIQATSNGNIGFSTSLFNNLYEKVTTQKTRTYDLLLISSKEKEKHYSRNLPETQFIRTHDNSYQANTHYY